MVVVLPAFGLPEKFEYDRLRIICLPASLQSCVRALAEALQILLSRGLEQSFTFLRAFEPAFVLTNGTVVRWFVLQRR